MSEERNVDHYHVRRWKAEPFPTHGNPVKTVVKVTAMQMDLDISMEQGDAVEIAFGGLTEEGYHQETLTVRFPAWEQNDSWQRDLYAEQRGY